MLQSAESLVELKAGQSYMDHCDDLDNLFRFRLDFLNASVQDLSTSLELEGVDLE